MVFTIHKLFSDSVEVLPSEPDVEYELETEEATEEGEQEKDDTLIPDTNNLNHQTESTGTITYVVQWLTIAIIFELI